MGGEAVQGGEVCDFLEKTGACGGMVVTVSVDIVVAVLEWTRGVLHKGRIRGAAFVDTVGGQARRAGKYVSMAEA